MRILSMTATFGKLEHETLTLTPGLNIITAPNEWGKSTWCAFLVAMLYGIDTRAKSTKTTLADKEHYAPWSGSPMSGSIRLLWQRRDITIQRHTQGRIPMGEFRAFETQSGLTVEALTADNCGEVLLGVERSVFLRAGFLRFTDLSVCQDEALRRRLNALVTTGDDSGCGELLGQKLKDLKNRCRYHRTGLLPQALEERQAIVNRLQGSSSRNRQAQRLLARKAELEAHIRALENHKNALRYAGAQNDEEKVAAAQDAKNRAKAALQALEEQSENLPTRQKAEEKLLVLNRLRDTWESIQMEEQMLPKMPKAPEPPLTFRDQTGAEAVAQAEAHVQEMKDLNPGNNGIGIVALVGSLLLLAVGGIQALLHQWFFAASGLVMGLATMIVSCIFLKRHSSAKARYMSRLAALGRHYGSPDPESWIAAAQAYQEERQDFQRRNAACIRLRGDLDERREEMLLTLAGLAQGRGLIEALRYWREVLSFWDSYADAFRTHQQAENHLQALRSMARSAQQPEEPDTLTCSEDEANAMLTSATQELKQIHQLLGQCQGQTEALGDDEELNRALEAIDRRIADLELLCKALELALATLEQASAELQRRFAPKITEHTQEIFRRLTGGKYRRLNLAQDLSLHAGAEGEDILRSQLWRSDGTVDQLYFALRLAVARELTPEAPLILDDALIRFDEQRRAAALEILGEEANTKQVILFTCQHREQAIAQKES